MAERVLVNAVQSILSTLASTYIQNMITSSLGAKGELRRLKKTIEDIKPLLVDAERRQHDSPAVAAWLTSLQEVIFDADDLVEKIAAEAKIQELTLRNYKMAKRVRFFFSISSNPLVFRLRLADKIKSIRGRLDDLKSTMSSFSFLVRDARDNVITKREETISVVRTEDIIGRDDDKNAILDMLLKVDNEDEQNPFVIPIVGIGGLGKTALAQLVYNDSIVQRSFEPKSWVCISEDFDVLGIVKKILGYPLDDKRSLETLRGVLNTEFGNKKYLIVLDDIWNEDRQKWHNLNLILPAGKSGSRILITTRSREVANIMRGSVPIYELKGLAPDKSWSLFKKVTEQPELESNLELADIGRQIVGKCANVPLAIRTLGSLLCCKDVAEWSYINDHELSNIDQSEQGILPVLKISYNYLPSHLKNCLVFCSLCPKDYPLAKEWLIHAWLAAGFIQPSSEYQNPEETGEVAFNSLLRRCFFQDLETNESGNIESFKIHDLIHDLATTVSGKQIACIEHSNPRFSHEECIRFVNFNYVRHTTWTVPSQVFKAKGLRLMNLTWRYDVLLPEPICNKMFIHFKFLRFLDLHALGIKKIPSSISNLKLLKFLDISNNTDLETLPNSFGTLVNLQMLDLHNCPSLVKLPTSFNRLINLWWLDITHCGSLTRKFTEINLQLLLHSPFTLTKAILHVNVSWWKHLRYILTLQGRRDDIQAKRPLLYLKIEHRLLTEAERLPSSIEELDIRQYDSCQIASWKMSESPCFYSNLFRIRIMECPSLQHLPVFCQLPSLKTLILQQMQALDYIESGGGGGCTKVSSATATTFFPCLEELELSCMPNLKGWSVQVESNCHLLPSFPRLRKLIITDCPNLTSMPLIPEVKFLRLKNVDDRLSQTLMNQTGKQQTTF